MRTKCVVVILGMVVAGLVPALGDGDSGAIYRAQAETSAVQFVAEVPLVIDPSLGYALSFTDQTPTGRGLGSVVEPGVAGRVALYTYVKVGQVPLSAECAFPDPPGPIKDDRTVGGAGTPLGTATCVSDDRPGNEAKASVLTVSAADNLAFREIHATSRTGLEGDAVVASTSSSIIGISLGGQTLTIDQLLSFSDARAGSGDDNGSSSSGVTITGAKVAGQAVAITEKGVVVGPTPLGVDRAAAQQAVDQALASSGITVRLLAVDHSTDTGAGRVVRGPPLDLGQPSSGETLLGHPGPFRNRRLVPGGLRCNA